jgi:ABC-type multidrug transport system fused ATPase/permease subunit
LVDTSSIQLTNWSTISLQHLHFTYEDQWQHAHTLADISLDLHRGKNIALVGESGSGKSTLLSLLRWLYDVDAVQLDIDGDMYEDLHILASTTSLIPQEPEIFEQSIRHNITMWLDIADEKIWEVLRIACLDEVIQLFPWWLNTDIKEKWVNLSWGQKQRLALARGLLIAEWSTLLLLDEPTSSVDSVNEVRIHEQIFHSYPEVCIVSSIHKLHLLELFDVVYVLDAWRVVESWPLDVLQKKWWVLTQMLAEYQV